MSDPWNDDSIQFPRLLAEIYAMGLHDDQIEALAAEMDLDVDRVYELLERAQAAWDTIKARDNTPPADRKVCAFCGETVELEARRHHLARHVEKVDDMSTEEVIDSYFPEGMVKAEKPEETEDDG